MAYCLDEQFQENIENPEISIRCLIASEVPMWDKIIEDSFKRSWTAPEDYFEFIKSDLINEKKRYYAGYYNEQLVSTGCLLIIDDCAYLYNLATVENLRRKGIAKEMIYKMSEDAKKLGIKYIIGATSNQVAEEMYKAFGAETCSYIEVYNFKVK